MIKAIIFDNFGVFTTDTWREFVGTLKPDQIEPARALNRAYDSAHITLDEFLHEIEELTGKQPQLVEKLLDSDTTKNTELLNYIKTLKPQYKIGLLSNVGTNWIRDSFLTQQEQALFDDFVFSFEVHMAKPDPEIFTLACERLGVEPKEAVMIDDIDRYCAVAKEQGMQAIQYTDFASMKKQLEAILANSNN
jgi:epoxide hydrolase-like predicted phosphatase